MKVTWCRTRFMDILQSLLWIRNFFKAVDTFLAEDAEKLIGKASRFLSVIPIFKIILCTLHCTMYMVPISYGFRMNKFFYRCSLYAWTKQNRIFNMQESNAECMRTKWFLNRKLSVFLLSISSKYNFANPPFVMDIFLGSVI